ncbi:HD-GYP domain-containing protein [Pseudoduganella namucuonensis]|uniref:HDIG domain-containing protein n=1 Tax=Pseudoduganella namucuonensis TaxID=1035707 RepID=A0A1I7IKM7_9BURK|nr:HD-GYP domain-containing protein [Pseudoduganella namucuonensis]SFU73490.1 HDIG domain-containing protein [Pseudoduganella namucuonensis]
MNMPDSLRISIDQLQVGLYVHLDLKWFEHPFAFSHFKIKNEEQLKTIRGLGLATVRYDPALSDAPPLPAGAPPSAPEPEEAAARPPTAAPEPSAELLAKRAMMARIKAQRDDAARIEHAFVNTAKAIRDIEKNLFSRPADSLRQANELITGIVDSILAAPELAIHVMGDKMGGEEVYYHSLNVTMLAMMIARDIKLPQEVAGPLAMGALMHDVGHKNIPDKILNKLDPLSHAEKNLYEMHSQYGADIGERLGLSAVSNAVIRDHHETFDGAGYPRGLKGEAIGVLARIVSIANFYDELCNPMNIAAALTPHEALSMMFAKLRGKFDPKLLQVFIRCLGVYPPGTIVQLSNGVMGMVATVNTLKPMKPIVAIYDASVPRDEAILVDMERESDLNIVKAIRPAQVPREIYHYLSPRKRVSYYFDAGAAGAAPP